MDVRCDRCGTEYEFDDALISERGTTVQCTECGSKFKVFPHQGAGVPEHWVVRGGGAAGWETHFSSLRDLQAAIVRGAVSPTDTISRGAEQPRPLSSIAELEQLFAERKKFGGTLAGVAPQASPPVTTRGVAPEHTSHGSSPETGSRVPEPPTEAMPAKRRVSTKMGLPTPVDAPPGFRSVSSPPPDLTPDLPRVEPHAPAAQTGSHAPVRPLERTLMSPSGASHAPRVPVEAPAPARSPDLARTQRSAESAPPGFAAAPAAPAAAPAAPAGFGVTMPSYGAPVADTGFTSPTPQVTTGVSAPQQSFAQTLPSHSAGFGSGQHVISKSPVPALGGEAQSPPRQRIVSALSFGDAQPSLPPAGSAPADTAPAFAKTMMGMSHAPAPPAAPAPAAPPLTPLPPAALPPAPTHVQHTQPMASVQQPPAQAVAPTQLAVPQVSRQAAFQPQPAFPQPTPQQQQPQRVVPPALPQPSYEEELPDHVAGMPGRRGPARVIVALLLLGAGGLAAATVGRPTIERLLGSKPAPTAVAPAPELGPLMTKAKELVQAGDLEGARRSLEQASALAKSAGSVEPSVARELVQVDVLAAEVEGLRLLLAAKEDTAHVDEVKKALDERLTRARVSIAEAARGAASEPDVVRAQMSLARLSGDRARALERKAVLPASSSAADAYALAALDLSDTPPNYGEAIKRLDPVASEGHLGLARSALIYALVQSGDRARAAEELKHLEEQAPDTSPLLIDVSSFLKREGVTAEPAVSGSAAPSGAPSAAVSAPPPGPGAPPGAPGGDFRTRLQRGSEALSRGDINQADGFYRSVVQEMPGNTEAVAGLAEVARRRGQSAEAARLYDQVLQSNPSYLPALVGRADMLWASGERTQALKLYRRVIDQAGTSNSYGKHAQERITAAESDRAPAPRESPAPTPSPSPAPTTDTPPGIDTTDLQ